MVVCQAVSETQFSVRIWASVGPLASIQFNQPPLVDLTPAQFEQSPGIVCTIDFTDAGDDAPG